MHVRCPGEGCKHQLSAQQIRSLASASALQSWKANQQAANARRAEGLASEDADFRHFCAQFTRACPSCHVIIYRHAGCDHMTCKCGHEFDWARTEGAKIGTDGRVDPAPIGGYRRPAQLAPHSRAEEEAQLAAAIAESLEAA